jgi:peptidoglycan hydrolase-like protein with peptidoglycan-binding domain
MFKKLNIKKYYFLFAILSPILFFSVTYSATYKAAGCIPTCVSFGQKGQQVAFLQEQLKANGYLPATSSFTPGVFDKATADAIKAFQKDKGIQVDGQVGQQTVDAMRQDPKMQGTFESSYLASYPGGGFHHFISLLVH